MYRSIYTESDEEAQPRHDHALDVGISREPSLLDISLPDNPGSTPCSQRSALPREVEAQRLSGRSARQHSAGATPSTQRSSRRPAPSRSQSPAKPLPRGDAPQGPPRSGDVTVLLRVIRSLQEEKTGLNNLLLEKQAACDRLQDEVARLQHANLEKDKQLSMVLANLYGKGPALGGEASC